MNNLMKFSNSYGHLIISIVAIAAGVILCLMAGTDGTLKGVGVSLVTTATGYWFVSSAATHNNQQPPSGTSMP